MLLIGVLIGYLLGRRWTGRERAEASSDPAGGGTETVDGLSQSTAHAGGAPEYLKMEFDSQLDLARAQMDMGDTAGARRTLRAVVKAGGATQREQAESLLQEIGSSAKDGDSGAKTGGSGGADSPG